MGTEEGCTCIQYSYTSISKTQRVYIARFAARTGMIRVVRCLDGMLKSEAILAAYGNDYQVKRNRLWGKR